MQLKEINETLNHRIAGGSEYGWNCYGSNARYLDYESDFAQVSIIFDSFNQTIYSSEVSAKDATKKVGPYRWLNPAFKDEMYNEATTRGVDPDQAWDNVKWIDLEVKEDFLEKAFAIFNGEECDTRIVVPLDLSDDLILSLAMEAHKRDITLNSMVELLLREVIDTHDKTNE